MGEHCGTAPGPGIGRFRPAVAEPSSSLCSSLAKFPGVPGAEVKDQKRPEPEDVPGGDPGRPCSPRRPQALSQWTRRLERCGDIASDTAGAPCLVPMDLTLLPSTVARHRLPPSSARAAEKLPAGVKMDREERPGRPAGRVAPDSGRALLPQRSEPCCAQPLRCSDCPGLLGLLF